MREYNQRPENKAKRSVYKRNRRRTDPQFRLANLLRSRFTESLSGKRKDGQSALAFLGCSIADLIAHLERQFVPGMSWENHGEWHVDHIIPVATFDLTNPDQIAQCFHFTNLRPLWAAQNQSMAASARTAKRRARADTSPACGASAGKAIEATRAAYA
jgi:hypothetical protein